MKGGVSAVDDGHALTCEYGFGDHTVLDLINRTKKSVFDQHFRDTLIRQARRQQEAIEAAWKDVTYAYAEIKRTYLR
jgi:hypothetical protein